MIKKSLQFLRSLGGFGSVTFAMTENHELRHDATLVTIKPTAQDRKNEAEFIENIKKQMNPGDRLELRYEAGNLVIAYVHRK